jgi:hypothetical protein
MPFKGDLRLGGPHDNEARLNGSSDGPSVPAAGTVMSSEQRPITVSVAVSVYHPEQGNVNVQIGTGVFNLLADGQGGTYEVLGTAVYVPAGEWVGPRLDDVEPHTASFDLGGGDYLYYQNGQYSVSRYISDGVGGVTFGQYAETYGDFFAYGTPVTGAPQYEITDQTSEHPQTMEQIPNGRYNFNTLEWDGNGNIYMGTGNMHVGGGYYPDGTLQSDASDTYVEVPEYSSNYYFDGNDNRWEWDGNGNIVFRYSGLYPYGTYITNYSDYNYYWNGSGGFYSEYSGSGGGGNGYPPSGEPTGNGSSTPIYVEINYSQYQIGSNDCVEYHDGSGGTYGSCSNNYYSYGTYLTSDGSYSYYSDGTGSYYSEWYDSSGGGGGYSTGPTGNTSSGTNYLYIPEASNNFENGTYYSTEYHDGMGGTYWDTTYSYQPYGYNFTSVVTGYDAEMMQDVYSYYNSDGNGSYYAS